MGHAPRFHESALDDEHLEPVLLSLAQLLDAHDPSPAVVLDRHWNVLQANRAAQRLVSALAPELAGPPINMFRASLHPDGLAAVTTNFSAWGTYLVDQLVRLAAITQDATLADLSAEIADYPNIRDLRRHHRWPAAGTERSSPLIPCILDLGSGPLSLFTTMTTFGTPRDITLDEITIELFYPADEPTRAALG